MNHVAFATVHETHPGGGLLLHRHVTALPRRDVDYFCSGAYISVFAHANVEIAFVRSAGKTPALISDDLPAPDGPFNTTTWAPV